MGCETVGVGVDPGDVPDPEGVPEPEDVPDPEDVPEPEEPPDGGVAAATVTVTEVTLVPDAFVAVKMYVVVWDGETTCEPLLATAAP